MAITIIVTNAGRAALVNATNTGTNAVTITQLGVTETAFVPTAGLVALPGEIKRIASVAGVVVANDAIHVTASDVTNAAYTMRGFGLYLNDGTLFATYGQVGPILNKTAESMMLLALDVGFADIDAELIAFGDTNFILPPATTEILGLVELATTAEGQAGTDTTRVLTPIVGKQSVLGWLLSQDGAGSGLDADMLDGLHASAFSAAAHTHGTMAEQNANNVNIIGGSIDGTTIGAGVARPGRFTSVIATGGGSGFGTSYPKGRVQISAQSSANTATAGVVGNDVSLFLTNSDPSYGLAFGTSGTGDTWLQGQRSDDQLALYDILLNPIGGAVGIGTLVPSGFLEVRHAGSVGEKSLVLSNTSWDRSLSAWADSDGYILRSGGWSDNSARALKIFVGGLESVRFSPLGNVGIGANPPITSGRCLAIGGGEGQVRLIGSRTYTIASGGNNQYRAGALVIYDNDGGEEIFFVQGPGGAGTYAKDFNVIGALTKGGNIVYHAGNDGAGSGLDADLLDGQQGAYYLPAATFSGAQVLSRLVAVDGAGSGLDADLLDGQQGAYYLPAATFNSAEVLARLVAVDGAGSGLDADLLDGQHGAYYLPAATFNSAEVLARLVAVDGAGSGLDADLLDGQDASAFVKYTDFTGANQSLGGSGYQKLPGGLIIQWGNYSVGANGSASASFPIAFPGACTFATVWGGWYAAGQQDNNPYVAGFTQYGATISSSLDVVCSGGFIAIGY